MQFGVFVRAIEQRRHLINGETKRGTLGHRKWVNALVGICIEKEESQRR